jgi:hypothetical protein
MCFMQLGALILPYLQLANIVVAAERLFINAFIHCSLRPTAQNDV